MAEKSASRTQLPRLIVQRVLLIQDLRIAGLSDMWNQRIKKPTFYEQVTDVNDCSLAVKEE